VTFGECIEKLGDIDPAVRLAAQGALQEEFTRWEPEVAIRVVLYRAEEDAPSERQKRRLGAILGDIVTPECVPLLVEYGKAESYAETIARRALRRWFDNAPVERVSRRILATLEENAERGNTDLALFLLAYLNKRAIQEPHISLWPVARFLEELERRRLNRQSRAWLGQFPTLSADHSPYLDTIQLLHSILPPHNLPRPTTKGSSSIIDLPRPADGSEPDADNLPVPAPTPPQQRALSLWERLFGRRQK
jgi:hypothetical protein